MKSYRGILTTIAGLAIFGTVVAIVAPPLFTAFTGAAETLNAVSAATTPTP